MIRSSLEHLHETHTPINHFVVFKRHKWRFREEIQCRTIPRCVWNSYNTETITNWEKKRSEIISVLTENKKRSVRINVIVIIHSVELFSIYSCLIRGPLDRPPACSLIALAVFDILHLVFRINLPIHFISLSRIRLYTSLLYARGSSSFSSLTL